MNLAIEVAAALMAMVTFSLGIYGITHPPGSKARTTVRPKAKKEPTRETPTTLDWCDGCDEIRPSTQMAFSEGLGLYRCAKCRGVEETKPEPSKPVETRQKRGRKQNTQKRTSADILTCMQQVATQISYNGVVAENNYRPVAMDVATKAPLYLSPHMIVQLRCHLKKYPEDYQRLVDRWGKSWIECECWDCGKVHDPPMGRCAECAEKFRQVRRKPPRFDFSAYDPPGVYSVADFGGEANCLSS